MRIMKSTGLSVALPGLLVLLVSFTAVGQDVIVSSSPEKSVHQQAENERGHASGTDRQGGRKVQPSTLSTNGEAGKPGLLGTAADAGLQPAGVCKVVNDLLASYCADRPDDLSCHFQ